MSVVIHETPGRLDLRALTTFGVNAKPNAVNPIGYFGTGLKYAIAVLVREGLKVTIWIENDPYVFYCEETEFRGKAFNSIRFKRQRGVTARWFSEPLPYTTELGRNWKLWMAYRELHSNTLDEGGKTVIVHPEDDDGSGEWTGATGVTRIVIGGDAYFSEWTKRGEVFLEREIKVDQAVQIFPGRSDHVFYRGLRVHELQKQSLFTYNINQAITLTEDRTAQYGFMIDHYIRVAIMKCENRDTIKAVLQASGNTYEAGIHWQENEAGYASPAFLDMVKIYGRRNTLIFIEREKKAPNAKPVDWRRELVIAIETGDDETLVALCKANETALKALLNRSLAYDPPNDKSSDEEIPS